MNDVSTWAIAALIAVWAVWLLATISYTSSQGVSLWT
jgi:hypothetical protein